jgi:ankyrin repeat protein
MPVDISLPSESFHIALQVAADRGHVRLVKLLLQVDGIDVNFRGGPLETAPLGLAARRGRSAIVKLLLDREGIEVNRQDDSGWTALCRAVHCNHLEAAKLLLERDDIDVNLPQESGWTALYLACHNGCQPLVDLLLERDDIDPNPRDDSGCTPLSHICRCSCGSVAIVRLLLSHPGIDPIAVDNYGVSILDQFRYRRNPFNNMLNSFGHLRDNEMLSLLIAAQLPVSTGQSPYLIAQQPKPKNR